MTSENGGAIRVESGIPMPSKQTGGRPCKFPWADMEVGDSFFVATNGNRNRAKVMSRLGPLWGRKRKPPRRFATRSVEENGILGVRVWRVE